MASCREAVQGREDLADLVVDIGDVGEVALARAADLRLGDVEGPPVAGIHQALRMRILLVVWDAAPGRQQVFAVIVEIPVLAAGDIGIVRMGETHRQAPGPRVGAPREIIDLCNGLMRDIVVVFELIGDLGDTGARHGSEVVVPPVDAFARLAVVGRPAEIGRIDVGGQAFLEAVQLIGSDEMHLA